MKGKGLHRTSNARPYDHARTADLIVRATIGRPQKFPKAIEALGNLFIKFLHFIDQCKDDCLLFFAQSVPALEQFLLRIRQCNGIASFRKQL